jgi:acyl carrier protein
LFKNSTGLFKELGDLATEIAFKFLDIDQPPSNEEMNERLGLLDRIAEEMKKAVGRMRKANGLYDPRTDKTPEELKAEQEMDAKFEAEAAKTPRFLELYEKMKTVIADRLQIGEDVIHPHSHFRVDLGAESIEQYELTYAFEDEFDVSIPDQDGIGFETVYDALMYVWNKLQKVVP